MAYKFWYKSDILSPTEYVYVIAYSEKQAKHIFYSMGYKDMEDYADDPVMTRTLSTYGIANYVAGDIVGEWARL